jgi:2-polyprenyl-3-methyl-5-hydroxy-6-metoxy-1,4-benzoquinol methylase
MAVLQDQYLDQGLSEAMIYAENYYRWILERAQPYLGRHIAEVGAGIGSFSQILAEGPYESLHLIEPNDILHAALIDRSKDWQNVQLYKQKLSGIQNNSAKSIDTMIYINVLEHIEDDLCEMQTVYNMLPSGGKVIIFVPALQFLFAKLDDMAGHYRRYHRNQLIKLMQAAKFRVLESRYMDSLGIVPYYLMCKVLQQTTLQETSVKLYDRVAVPVLRHIEKFITPPIGKNIFLVAQRD